MKKSCGKRRSLLSQTLYNFLTWLLLVVLTYTKVLLLFSLIFILSYIEGKISDIKFVLSAFVILKYFSIVWFSIEIIEAYTSWPVRKFLQNIFKKLLAKSR